MNLLDAAECYFLGEQRFALISLVTSPDNDATLRLELEEEADQC